MFAMDAGQRGKKPNGLESHEGQKVCKLLRAWSAVRVSVAFWSVKLVVWKTQPQRCPVFQALHVLVACCFRSPADLAWLRESECVMSLAAS